MEVNPSDIVLKPRFIFRINLQQIFGDPVACQRKLLLGTAIPFLTIFITYLALVMTLVNFILLVHGDERKHSVSSIIQ